MKPQERAELILEQIKLLNHEIEIIEETGKTVETVYKSMYESERVRKNDVIKLLTKILLLHPNMVEYIIHPELKIDRVNSIKNIRKYVESLLDAVRIYDLYVILNENEKWLWFCINDWRKQKRKKVRNKNCKFKNICMDFSYIY